MKSNYTQDIIQFIEHQEFYNEMKDYLNSEVFEDVIDFLKIYNAEWYIELGEWSSEFLLQHLNLYNTLYRTEKFKIRALKSLYFDLDRNYKEYQSDYKFQVKKQEALHSENDISSFQ